MFAGHRPDWLDQPRPRSTGEALRRPALRFERSWNGVADAIIAHLGDRLPPPAPDWHEGLLTDVYRYRKDGSLAINTGLAIWRDERTGREGRIFPLLSELLGSPSRAFAWMRQQGFFGPLEITPLRAA